MSNEIYFGLFMIGLILGLICGSIYTGFCFDTTLNRAGIEKLEKCHNTHSNWVEIVWLKK